MCAAVADQLGRANQFTCTILGACRLRRGRGHGSSHNRTPLPMGVPWRPSDGPRVGLVELLQEGRVRNVGAGDPCAVLRPVTHPVHQVVEIPRVRGSGGAGAGGDRSLVDLRLDLGDVEHWVDLEEG